MIRYIEMTVLFGYCEKISDIAWKKITGHPLNRPQAKSTRYISFGKTLDLSLEDPDILSLPNADKYLEHIAYMNKRYLEVSEELAGKVFGHKYTSQVVEFLKRPENVEAAANSIVEEKLDIGEIEEAKPSDYQDARQFVLKGLDDKQVRRDIGKFVLDYSRVYLLAVTKTSGGFSPDARTIEEIITDMISSPRIEDQKKGNALWDEAKKVSPVLLGERGHVKIDQWKVKNETELRNYMEERFGDLEIKNHSDDMINLLHPGNMEMYSDRFNAALTVFPYVDLSLVDIMKQISTKDVSKILSKAHEHRGDYDVLHPAISHGGLMPEILMAYHGYRDIFRHRRGSRSVQLLTTRLGFEVPEIFKVFGMEEDYLKDMEKCSEIFEEARKVSPHKAEKLVPFGANCRSLYSWQPNQIGYIGKLRSDIRKGNVSYVLMARELVKKVSKLMPETAKYFKVDDKMYPAELWKSGYDFYDEIKRGERG